MEEIIKQPKNSNFHLRSFMSDIFLTRHILVTLHLSSNLRKNMYFSKSFGTVSLYVFRLYVTEYVEKVFYRAPIFVQCEIK